jgi:hypothetical protein
MQMWCKNHLNGQKTLGTVGKHNMHAQKTRGAGAQIQKNVRMLGKIFQQLANAQKSPESLKKWPYNAEKNIDQCKN